MGTDWPVSSIDPWFGFETLVTRENPRAEMEGRLGQSITPQEAIRMLTINGACAMGCEDVSGSITTGKTADIIVLDRNLLEIEVKGNWHKSQVRLTMVDGEVVHDPEGWMQGAEFESRITSPVPDFIPADI